MKMSRQKMPALGLTAFYVLLGALLAILPCTSAVAQDTGKTAREAYEHRVATILQTANSNITARKLATERLQFLRRLNRKYSFSLSEYGGHWSLLLFPTLRSDRAYVFIVNGNWPENMGGADEDCILCFQRKSGSVDRLVYRVDFTVSREASGAKDDLKDPARQAVKSLSDFVRSLNCHFHGRISRYAKADLSAQGEYTGYTDEYMNVDLAVFLISTGEFTKNTFDIEHYRLFLGPVPTAKSTASEFYDKYGLPVSLYELKKLQPRLPAELLAPAPDPFASSPSTR